MVNLNCGCPKERLQRERNESNVDDYTTTYPTGRDDTLSDNRDEAENGIRRNDGTRPKKDKAGQRRRTETVLKARGEKAKLPPCYTMGVIETKKKAGC